MVYLKTVKTSRMLAELLKLWLINSAIWWTVLKSENAEKLASIPLHTTV